MSLLRRGRYSEEYVRALEDRAARAERAAAGERQRRFAAEERADALEAEPQTATVVAGGRVIWTGPADDAWVIARDHFWSTREHAQAFIGGELGWCSKQRGGVRRPG